MKLKLKTTNRLTANENKPAFVEMTSSVSENILTAASHNFYFEVEYSAADDS